MFKTVSKYALILSSRSSFKMLSMGNFFQSNVNINIKQQVHYHCNAIAITNKELPQVYLMPPKYQLNFNASFYLADPCRVI